MANVIPGPTTTALVLAPNETLTAQGSTRSSRSSSRDAVGCFVSYGEYPSRSLCASHDLFIRRTDSINDHIERFRLHDRGP